ncbi:hypothetical protein [Parasphingorhabdus cellanae]|uniref:Uncharacterized protein n=1 Tax=Parasphingorhabdus cellanae TaxID=2806553 RepID=A0ABX7T8R5_9SPHN|nr:hypothetical protein [Parasphingorhabdus cellanae]QTD57172.1 hypothetical protein J4G78_06400 [Parasphingorhabdus cellanae]
MAHLRLEASLPNDSRTEFLFATCVGLLDCFENPERARDFHLEWDEFSDNYRQAMPPVRAALMNGFGQAQEHPLISKLVNPTASDRTTLMTDDVLNALMELARSLSPRERCEIAESDYGADAKKQLVSLNRLLESSDCRIRSGESWFPAEVIELASHDPQNSGFVGCTALVLINAIHNKGFDGQSASRWRAHHLAYRNLKLPEREIIISGFRHIYEIATEWDPYWDYSASDPIPINAIIPTSPDIEAIQLPNIDSILKRGRF